MQIHDFRLWLRPPNRARARSRALTVAGLKRVAVGEREKAATDAFGEIQGIDNEH